MINMNVPTSICGSSVAAMMEMPDVPPIAKLLGDLKKWMPAASSTKAEVEQQEPDDMRAGKDFFSSFHLWGFSFLCV